MVWYDMVWYDNDVSEFLSNDFDFDILDKKSKMYDAQYGHVQFVSRKSYIEAGMENENFRGSSPEDKERFYSFVKCGKVYNTFCNHLVFSCITIPDKSYLECYQLLGKLCLCSLLVT